MLAGSMVLPSRLEEPSVGLKRKFYYRVTKTRLIKARFPVHSMVRRFRKQQQKLETTKRLCSNFPSVFVQLKNEQ